MIREHVFSGSTPSDKFFRWRGGEVSRLENLSDVVFALCLTMLVAVPTARAFQFEYDQLVYSIKMLPAFLACFLILIWIWYQHHKFFRRYGLGDWLTVAQNTLLLFVVVSYTLPLRFVFSMLLDPVVGLQNVRIDKVLNEPAEAGFLMTFSALASWRSSWCSSPCTPGPGAVARISSSTNWRSTSPKPRSVPICSPRQWAWCHSR